MHCMTRLDSAQSLEALLSANADFGKKPGSHEGIRVPGAQRCKQFVMRKRLISCRGPASVSNISLSTPGKLHLVEPLPYLYGPTSVPIRVFCCKNHQSLKRVQGHTRISLDFLYDCDILARNGRATCPECVRFGGGAYSVNICARSTVYIKY